MSNEIMVIRVSKKNNVEIEQYDSDNPNLNAITILLEKDTDDPDTTPKYEERVVDADGRVNVRSTPRILSTNIVAKVKDGDDVTVYETHQTFPWSREWIRIHPTQQRWIAKELTRKK